MNDLHRCVLIGVAIGAPAGITAMWHAPTWAAALIFWLPIITGVIIAFVLQGQR